MKIILGILMLVWILRIDGKCLNDIKDVRKNYFYDNITNIITIESSNRASHNITSNILLIYLKEILGYQHVNIVYPPDGDPMDPDTSIDRLNFYKTDKDYRLINLEVWLDISLVFPKGYMVVESGLITEPGRFGWFLRHIDDFPWKNLREEKAISSLVLSQKEWDWLVQEANFKFYIPSYCNNSNCATLLAGHKMDFVEKAIEGFKLKVKIVWLAEKLEHVIGNFSESRPLLALSYSPGFLSAFDDWYPIHFPLCETDFPYSTTGCAFGPRRLTKLVSLNLVENAVDAYRIITRMHFTRKTYVDFYRTAQQHPEMSHQEIACSWMKNNNITYKSWNAGLTGPPELFIFGVFPEGKDSHGIAHAAAMAVNAVNNNSILPNHVLKLVNNRVGQCNAKGVLAPFVHYVLGSGIKNLVGILGPPCSDTVEPLVNVAQHFDVVTISYSAEGSVILNDDEQSFFFRTIGENSQYTIVYLKLLQQFKWKRMAALTEDGQKYTEYLSHLQDLLKSNNLTFITHRKFPRNRNSVNMRASLEDLQSRKARIIVADIDEAAARSILCEAYLLKMTAAQGYIWFLPSWLSNDWYNVDKLGNLTTQHSSGITCTTSDMRQALQGHFSLSQQSLAPDDVVTHENKTVKEWRNQFLNDEMTLSDYATYAYDAVWAYALALHKLELANESYLDNLHSEPSSTSYKQLIQQTEFVGVSGRIHFSNRSSRVTNVNIRQWVDGHYHIVGTAIAETKENIHASQDYRLEMNISAIRWFSGDGPPGDGEEASYCPLQGLADILNLDCIGAIIVANVVGFAVVTIILVTTVIFTKHRYDKKVEQLEMTEKYIKSIGLDFTQNVSELDKWEIPKDKVVINRRLGEGAFGTVYGGEVYYEDKGWVAAAVKTLKLKSTTDQKLDFLTEAEVMKRFDHKNIVKLLGVCTREEPVYTVMEFMLYGDLKTYLLNRRHLLQGRRQSEESNDVSPKRLTSMALDIARGLSYLTSLKYVHRDIASRNCLINSAKVAKLADFGLTRRMYESDYYKFSRRGMLPIRWMAPESLADGVFTPSSDVWSFGVVLFEIITFGSYPFQGLTNTQVVEHVKEGNTIQLPSRGIKAPLECLIKSCWNPNYKKRPPISDIVVFLANNPRILIPCVDQPTAYVENESGIFESPLSFPGYSPHANTSLFPIDETIDHIDETDAEDPLLPPVLYPPEGPSSSLHEP